MLVRIPMRTTEPVILPKVSTADKFALAIKLPDTKLTEMKRVL